MKTYHIILFLLIMCIITACNRPRIVVESDDTEGFHIVKVYGGDTICPIIFQKGIAIVDSIGEPREGRFFHYHTNDSIFTRFICCRLSNYGTIIDGHIDDDVSDTTFLIVDQKPVDLIFGNYFYDGKRHMRREYDTCRNYSERTIMLNLSRIHQYWILNIKTADVWGPFSYDDYLDMKKQLGVPPDLMLKREKYDIYNNK